MMRSFLVGDIRPASSAATVAVDRRLFEAELADLEGRRPLVR
jgi:hypothetical protein